MTKELMLQICEDINKFNRNSCTEEEVTLSAVALYDEYEHFKRTREKSDLLKSFLVECFYMLDMNVDFVELEWESLTYIVVMEIFEEIESNYE